MARSIDERIVEMRFDNRQFEQGVTKSLKTLEALKEGLKLDEAAKSLENLEVAGNKFNLQSMADSLDGIANRFSTMGIIGMTVIANLTNAALDFAKRGASAVLTPILEGGRKRALNIEQAKFQFKGLGMDVEATMASANEAVLGTAYGLDEAARVAGQLGATGMRAGEDMTSALRAVAGVAAMTSSSYDDMGHIFTTIAGNGRLMGMQLTQLATKGLNAAAILANEFGTTEAVIREMVSKGQVSFDMFYKAMDNAFGEHATKANDLYTGSLANMKAALSRIGAKIQTPHLENMRDIFNSLSPVINNVNKALDPFIDFLNRRLRNASQVVIKLAESFHDFDRVHKIIAPLNAAVMILYQALKAIVDPIKEAFGEVFTPVTYNDIVKIAEAIRDFSAKLLITGETGNKIKMIFKGLFSVLDLIGTVIYTVIRGIGMLFGAVVPAGGGILGMAAALGQLATRLNESVQASGIFESVLKGCAKVFDLLTNMFEKFKIASTFIIDIFKKIGAGLSLVFSNISKGIEGINFDGVLKVLQGGIIVMILKGIDNLLYKTSRFIKTGGRINKLLISFGKTLTILQHDLKSRVIQRIAISIGILAVALLLLSTIDPDRMATGLVGVTTLVGSLMALVAMVNSLKFMKLQNFVVITATINAMATAILILAFAMRVLSGISWADTAKGILSISALMAMLVVVSKMLAKNKRAMAKGAVGLISFAIAINILAKAVKSLGGLDADTLKKGLGSIAVLIAELVTFMKILGKTKMSVTSAVGLILLGAALNIFAKAVAQFGAIDTATLKKGLIALGVVLLQLGIFMNLIGDTKRMMTSAIGLTILGAALLIFTKSIEQLGNMETSKLQQGLTALAISLGLLIVTLKLVSGGILGAIALMIISAALVVFVGALGLMGSLPTGNLIKAILGLAGAIAVIGGTALLLSAAVVPMLAFSVALLAIGAATLFAGLGIAALATGLTLLAVSGTAGVVGLIAIFKSLFGLIPAFFKQIGAGIKGLLSFLATLLPEIAAMFMTIFGALLDTIIDLGPKFKILGKFILDTLIEIFTEYIPKMAKAGIDILLAVLTAIKDNIRQVVETAGMIIVNFLEGIATMLPAIIQAGFDVILAFINGLADAIENNTEPMIESVERLMDAIVTAAINWLKSSIEKFKKTGKKIMESGFIQGIKDKLEDLKKAAGKIYNYIKQAIDEKWEEFKSLGTLIIDGLIDGIKGAAGAVIRALKNVLTDMLSKAKEILGIQSPSKEAYEIGRFFDLGLAKGLTSFATDVTKSAKSLGDKMLDTITESVRKVNDILDADMSLNPTITPILDLSDIRKGMSGLNNIMDKAPTINVGSIRTPITTSSEQKDIQKGDASMTFVQNNYSPKALSRADIYRQTKNQFAAAKGLVTP